MTPDDRCQTVPAGEITSIGRILWWTGCVRYYRDGSGISALFRRWHPITWLTWIVALQICGIVGEPVNDVVPTRLRGYWRDHQDEIQWLRL
jgi:hypothetical protein